MRRRFVMKGNELRAGLDKLIGVTFGLDDHQVRVERQVRQLAQIGDDLRAPTDVGDEGAVHRVEMEHVGAAGFGRGDLLGDPREVGSENRRCQTDFARHLGSGIRAGDGVGRGGSLPICV